MEPSNDAAEATIQVTVRTHEPQKKTNSNDRVTYHRPTMSFPPFFRNLDTITEQDNAFLHFFRRFILAHDQGTHARTKRSRAAGPRRIIAFSPFLLDSITSIRYRSLTMSFAIILSDSLRYWLHTSPRKRRLCATLTFAPKPYATYPHARPKKCYKSTFNIDSNASFTIL
jgi:hypothetical protein